MKYIIGVDGGGTKTEAMAYNLEGDRIGRGLSGFGNILINFDEAVENIQLAIKNCMDSILEDGSDGECSGIFLGIAGIEVGKNTEKLESIIRKEYSCEIKVFHDTVLAHAALFKGSDGIITISGTGSVCYGEYKGNTARTGGWGHILGDEGSGYFIALEAFKRMTIEEDSGCIRSELTRTIMGKLGLDNINDLKKFIYSARKAEIAAYAPVVAELANTSEINSTAILKEAGKELAIITERLYKRLEIKEFIRIGIAGSILKNVDIVRDEFTRYIETNMNSVQIFFTEETNATKGAYYIHKKLINLKGKM